MEEKINCWEYMECGREPKGSNAETFGTCPASTNKTFHGINKGKNAGRFCWKVAGTMCFDTIKGISISEIISCHLCPFFNKVEKEEGASFS